MNATERFASIIALSMFAVLAVLYFYIDQASKAPGSVIDQMYLLYVAAGFVFACVFWLTSGALISVDDKFGRREVIILAILFGVWLLTIFTVLELIFPSLLLMIAIFVMDLFLFGVANKKRSRRKKLMQDEHVISGSGPHSGRVPEVDEGPRL